jgi:hypothetical protein
MEFLLPETTVREAGAGPAIDIGEERGGTLILTLGITRILEKESIDVSIWGSPDGLDWGCVPLASFPQKFYCGVYPMFLDLSARPEIRYLRAQWDAGRWALGTGKPLFAFYLEVRTAEHRLAFAGA